MTIQVIPSLLGLLAPALRLLPVPERLLRRLARGGSGAQGVAGVTEARLEQFEIATLGQQHAAEHVQARKILREGGHKARSVTDQPAGGFRNLSVAAGPSNVDGEWGAAFNIPVFAINSALLPTGKVLIYAYPNHPDVNPPGPRDEAWAYLWDPSLGTGAGAFKLVNPPIDPATGKPVNIWCSGTSFTPDGRVLVTGGNLNYIDATHPQFAGLNHVYTFNPFTETWARQPNMAHGRWYPSQMAMPNGKTLILQGSDESANGVANRDVEVFTPSASMTGTNGVVQKVGTLASPQVGDYYPQLFWMPSGRGLVAGPWSIDSWLINNSILTNTFAVTEIPNMNRSRVWGNATLVPNTTPGSVSTKVLEIGGSDTGANPYENAPATNLTEQWDEAAGNGSGWVAQASQNIARSHANTVLLPDGSMVTVGGGTGSDSTRNRLWTANTNQRQVELWDPVAKTWRLGAAQAESRAYHSTALLLPDGRVMSAGDDYNGGTLQDSAEIYSPPYLFKGARPTITNAPAAIAYNTTFNVDTPDGVTRAALVAPGAVTHATNGNQRYLSLTLSPRAGGVTLTAPTNANAALPGYYMLFLLSADGVPSVAKWVNLSATAPGNQVPVASASGSPTSGAVPLNVVFSSAGSADPDGSITAYEWDLDGDGAFDDSTAANPSFQYTVAGSYTVKLRVTDNATPGAQTISSPVTITATSGGGGGTVVEKAQGKPASASSSENSTWAVASSANDGSIDSRWSSQFLDNQWWQVDLGSVTPVSSADLNFVAWAWPATYTVSVSTNGTSWAVVASETLTSGGSKQKVSNFAQTDARYVRVTGVTRGTGFGTSIVEAKVYGPSGGGGGGGNQVPVASASGSPTSGAVPLNVVFSSAGSADPDGSITAYEWDLDGDGAFDDSTAANPSFQYTVAGSYTVKLRVTDNATPGAQTISSPVTITATSGGGGGTVVEKAQGKPASASSSENSTWAVASSANDGSIDSRWSSQFLDNQWWQVDLGSVTPVSSADLNFVAWAWPATYTVSVSTNGTSWAVVASETLTSGGSKQKVSNFAQTDARYVRVTGVTRGTGFGTSIVEAKVYGPSGGGGGGGNQVPVASASGSPTSGAVPLNVVFSSAGSADPDGSITAYEWDLDGDGAFDDSTAANPSFQYTVAGSYTVKLRVTDNATPGAQTISSPVTITATSGGGGGNQVPVASASGSPTSGAVPLNVVFSSAGSADPDGSITAYEWDLDGDGAFDDSTAANPSFQYTVAGSYTVKLRVTDNATPGAQTISSPVTITATSGGGGGTVVEKAQGKPASASSSENSTWAVASSANDGSIDSRWSSQFLDNQWWQVDLGSVTPVSSADLNFVAWAWPATYTVSVSTNGTSWAVVASETLTSGGSKQKVSNFAQTDARYVRVTGVTRGTGFGTSIVEAKVYGPSGGGGGGGNQVPVASASGSPTSGAVPLNVVFSSAGSVDPDGSITAYEWDLDGDGAFDDSTAANPSFQYTVAGSYTVKLRVTDNATPGAQTISSPITITATSGGGGGTFAFGSPTAIATGSQTHSVIAVDVDGDGDKDLVGAVAQANAVAVSLNNGSGVFGAPTLNATGAGSYPKHAAAGDVNGDGNVDLVSANQNNATITVLRGNGNGTFLAGVVYPACSAPHEAAFGDLNGDGRQDVAVTCYGGAGNVFSVLLNTASNTLAAKIDYPTATGGRSLVLRDFNADGDLDIAIAAIGGQVAVHANNGSGVFGSATSYSFGSPAQRHRGRRQR